MRCQKEVIFKSFFLMEELYLIDRIPEWEWTWGYIQMPEDVLKHLCKWQRHLYLGGLPTICRKPERVHYKFRFYLLKVKRQVHTQWHPQLSQPTTCAGISKSLCFRLCASILAGPHRLSTMAGILDPATLLLPSKIPLIALVASSHFWLTDAFIHDAVSQPPPSPVPVMGGAGAWGKQTLHSMGPYKDIFESPSPSSFNKIWNHCS